MFSNSKQMVTGKAFEFALLREFYERLRGKSKVKIIKNKPFATAKQCFDSFNINQRGRYLLVASFAVNFLIDIEPRLSNGIGVKDVLELEIVSDQQGQKGDVRDVLAIRLLQKWEIGISAKNNHHAVKHSRLSYDIDFGNKWLGIKCSKKYFEEIKPIFHMLAELRAKSQAKKKWVSLGDYHSSVYVPILNAFMGELLRLNVKNPGLVARNLVEYLVGKKDFYKVIGGKNFVEIQSYNLHGLLNLPFRGIKPKFNTKKVELPDKLLDISYKKNSRTSLIVKLNKGWILSFRIHNASSRIEPSLKFDINLLSAPNSLFTNKLAVIDDL